MEASPFAWGAPDVESSRPGRAILAGAPSRATSPLGGARAAGLASSSPRCPDRPLVPPPPLPSHREMDASPRPGRRRWLVAFLLLFLLYGWPGPAEPDWPAVPRHVAPLKAARPLKLAHVSDLHTTGLDPRE